MADPITAALEQAVQDGVFPGAVLLVQHGARVERCDVAGHAALQPSTERMTRATLFDLASLTKPIATATAVLQLIRRGALALDQPVAQWLPDFRGDGKEQITLFHLLNHSSGLPAWKPFYKAVTPDQAGLATAQLHERIMTEPLVYPTGSQSIYSDLGFILLGLIVERSAGRPLDRVCRDELFAPLGMDSTGFRPLDRPELAARSIAATEQCAWRGRLLRGEVHDENCYALGGVSGHAGLFAPADDLARFVGALIEADGEADRGRAEGPFAGVPAALLNQFLSRQSTPGSSWGLGWDTPSDPSSSGRWFSPRSCGHLGYTGTSLWIDRDRGWSVLLLTNRVHPTSRNVKISDFRPLIHNLIAETFFKNS
ncbi:MAG: beta-lactamase family protein [Nitrospirae bacterium]|nr:beta-lactamase family protein [Nitrospirota bacterium]